MSNDTSSRDALAAHDDAPEGERRTHTKRGSMKVYTGWMQALNGALGEGVELDTDTLYAVCCVGAISVQLEARTMADALTEIEAHGDTWYSEGRTELEDALDMDWSDLAGAAIRDAIEAAGCELVHDGETPSDYCIYRVRVATKLKLTAIEINGITYAPVEDAPQDAPQGSPVLVCGGKTGRAVLIGYARERIELGEPYTLHNARMLIYWPSACGGLLGFAQDGPKSGTRLSQAVDEVSDAIAHQVMPLSASVMAAIREWEVYRGSPHVA